MRKPLIGGIAVCLLTAATASGGVRATTNRGLVSIFATDATPREILAEWARVGGMTVVNLDGIPGDPLTIELVNIPEGQALEVVLRSVTGYVAAARHDVQEGRSIFDRVYVIPLSNSRR